MLVGFGVGDIFALYGSHLYSSILLNLWCIWQLRNTFLRQLDIIII